MKKEKAVLSFLAVFIGLVVAGAAFYIFQLTKTLPPQKARVQSITAPTKAPKSDMFLAITEPSDEFVSDRKVVKIAGKTNIDAIVIIMTKTDQEVLKPTRTGDFSTTININDGVNLVKISAIASDGEEKSVLRTISFTEEEF
ncbi:MAG: hypothetical protein M1450_04360 [Patescibacteria group bacterium]|nr:hypothetical protein [Patescibacteria group bacterium]